jgi:uncharacterized repeat protein (TIGR01451 family)
MATVMVVTQVAPGTPIGTTIANIAAVTSNSIDPQLADNREEVGVMVGPVADLALTKRAVITMATPGTQVSYLLNVTNHGPMVATSVVVTDTLPRGFLFIDTNGLCRAKTERIVICTIGTLAVGESLEFAIYTFMTLEAITGDQRNVAVAASAASYDPTPLNNRGDAVVAVLNTPTAIAKISLSVQSTAQAAQIYWLVPDATNIAGFHLWRGTSVDRAQATRQSQRLITVHGAIYGNEYAFTDQLVTPGTIYHYWVEAVRVDGQVSFHGPVPVLVAAHSYQLYLPLIGQGTGPRPYEASPVEDPQRRQGARITERERAPLLQLYLPFVHR